MIGSARKWISIINMNGSNKGIRIEFRSERLPAIRLTKLFMEGLLDVVHSQFEQLNQVNASFAITFTDKKAHRTIAFIHKNDFLEDLDSYIKNFSLIRISLDSPTRKVSVELWSKRESTYSVMSDDSDWATIVRSKITEVLEKYQTHYDFLHSSKSWIIWGAFGLIVVLVFAYYQPPKTIFTTVVNIFLLPWSVAFWSATFVRWLFPKFEIENTIQLRFRKWILGGLIGGFIVGLIVTLFSSLFH